MNPLGIPPPVFERMRQLRRTYNDACIYARTRSEFELHVLQVVMGYGGETMVENLPQPLSFHIWGAAGTEAIVEAQKARGRRFRALCAFKRGMPVDIPPTPTTY